MSGRLVPLVVELVDARPWTRETLARALEGAAREVVVRRHASLDELVEAAASDGPRVILLIVGEGSLAAAEGAEALGRAVTAASGVPVVALCDGDGVDAIMAALDRGLRGYVPASLEPRVVVNALRFVAAGGTFIPAEPVLQGLAPASAALGEASIGPEPTVATTLDQLTPRETTVLGLLRQGKSNKLIARELGVREPTIKVHVGQIMRKLGATNRTQVALIAETLLAPPEVPGRRT